MRVAWLTALALIGLSLPAWHAHLPGETLHWLGDLAVHWQWAYAVVGAIAALAWCLLARGPARRWAVAAALAVAALGLLNLRIFSLQALAAPPASSAPAAALRVVSFNLHMDNDRPQEVLGWLDAQSADVVGLVEVSSGMATLTQALAKRYPHAVQRPRDDPFGMAVFARYPLQGAFADEGAAHHWAGTLQAPMGAVALHVLHPMPPISSADLAARDALLASIGTEPAPSAGRLVLGDFNSTPWAASMRAMGERGLARASGLVPTWSLGASLPLDHILASRTHWRVAAHGTGPHLGSDHRPVWAVLHAQPLN